MVTLVQLLDQFPVLCLREKEGPLDGMYNEGIAAFWKWFHDLYASSPRLQDRQTALASLFAMSIASGSIDHMLALLNELLLGSQNAAACFPMSIASQLSKLCAYRSEYSLGFSQYLGLILPPFVRSTDGVHCATH